MRIATVSCLAIAVTSAAAWATWTAPKPGTPRQVAALVVKSKTITALPSSPDPTLDVLAINDVQHIYPKTAHGCSTATQCLFGDLSARRTIVLFGDSHARMWLPALVPYAKSSHFKVVLLWLSGCPAAAVSVWNLTTGVPFATCDTWRTSTIALIDTLRPALVLIASHTTRVYTSKGPTKVFTSAQWEKGDEATIRALKNGRTKIALIGDIVGLTLDVPTCLAAHPTAVRTCSVANPNPAVPRFYKAEALAAKATHVTYLNPIPWLCTKKCSTVIGHFLVYTNNNHICLVFAEYLSTVFGDAVKKLKA